jgi:hypothetical protein
MAHSRFHNLSSLGRNIVIIQTRVQHPSLVERFVRFLCEELNVFPDRIAVISYDGSDGNFGLCIDETNTEFLILVKESDRDVGQIFTTIAHEMIHVKQYMKENLGWFLDNRSYLSYHDRWWEREAFEKAVPLVEKFSKNITLDH